MRNFIKYITTTSATFLCFFILMFLSQNGKAQSLFEIPQQTNKRRLIGVSGGIASSYTAVVVGLSQAWYSQYDRGKFHFYNDNAEWLQHDKAGHFWTAYVYTDYVVNLYRWTGIEERKALWSGAAVAWAAQATVEVLDGFSQRWGASTGDLLANTFGVGLYVGQELLWQEQIFQLKFSSHKIDYSKYPNFVQERAKNLYGTTLTEQLLKDYNSQVYWLSFNPFLFSKRNTKVPKWLQLSVGYGIKQVFGGYENEWEDALTGEIVSIADEYPQIRQYYLALDIDLTRIPVKKAWAKTLLHTLNILKFPLPAIEVDSRGGVFFRPIMW